MPSGGSRDQLTFFADSFSKKKILKVSHVVWVTSVSYNLKELEFGNDV